MVGILLRQNKVLQRWDISSGILAYLAHRKTAAMFHMGKQWVYIYSGVDEQMVIGTTSDTHRILEYMKTDKKKILYLCPFEQSFDALAQKSLLGRLSKFTIKDFISKHRESTDLWIRQLVDSAKADSI